MAYHGQRVTVLSKCYAVEGRRVGKGQFAEVFRARLANPTGGGDGLVALKVERDDATLMHEYKVLKVTAWRGITDTRASTRSHCVVRIDVGDPRPSRRIHSVRSTARSWLHQPAARKP